MVLARRQRGERARSTGLASGKCSQTPSAARQKSSATTRKPGMVPLSRQGAATLCVTRSSAPPQPVHVCHSCPCPVRVSQEWETDQTAVRSWEELTLKQREAATFLGYTAHEWDEEMRGSEPPPDNGRVQKFADGEDVLAYDSSGKCLPAKILQSRRSSDAADGGGREYKVHYRGWKSKWDCWIGTAAVFKKTAENLEEVKRSAADENNASGSGAGKDLGQKRKRASDTSSIEQRLAERRRARVDVSPAKPTMRKDPGSNTQREPPVMSHTGPRSASHGAAVTSPPRDLVWDENSQSYTRSSSGVSWAGDPASPSDAGTARADGHVRSSTTRQPALHSVPAADPKAQKRKSASPRLPKDDPWQKKYDDQRKQEYWWNPTTCTSTWVRATTKSSPHPTHACRHGVVVLTFGLCGGRSTRSRAFAQMVAAL
eukprot:COSAG02_NODE_12_length_58022_cov_242.077379_3_plen_429_part_00